jgi:hypothetical protein
MDEVAHGWWSESARKSLIIFGIGENCLISGRCLIVPVYKKDDKTD